jgi:hypothetical protein
MCSGHALRHCIHREEQSVPVTIKLNSTSLKSMLQVGYVVVPQRRVRGGFVRVDDAE